jgi:hypothetical protein
MDKFGTGTNFIRAVPNIERSVNGPSVLANIPNSLTPGRGKRRVKHGDHRTEL